MIRKMKSAMSVILAVMIFITCFAFSDFSVYAESGNTVYVNNNIGWQELYCFMWNNNGDAYVAWPGERMKELDDNLWSYQINNNYKNIIFNNGGFGAGNQTDDLILPKGADYVFDLADNEWSLYDDKIAPVITCDKIDGYQFKGTANLSISARYAETSYYTVNDGEQVDFKENVSFVIGDDTDTAKEYTVKVYSQNSYGVSEKTFTFSKIIPTSGVVGYTAVPEYADNNCLYAHAEVEAESTQTWQKWETQSGPYSESGVYYFFLPNTASDAEVEIYNTYSNNVIINDIEIEPFTSAVVRYTVGESILASIANSSESAYLQIYKSDSEVSLYINDTTGSYTDSSGNTMTDFYSFLVADKENAVNGSSCTVIDEDGVNETVLKKIKGRGNSTWRDSDKKPFNITFNSKTSIGGISSKKFSLLANAKDGSLLRNRVMYDLADEVGSLYSSDSRTVDLYINGSYRGAYQITQKVELGKNSLVSLKDESDELTEDFNFLIEVDIWNYAGDVYFESDRGLHIVFNTPDLEGYDGVDETLNAQYEFMRSKYQQFEDALYSGDMSDLEKICDVDSLARAYLLQEFGKNCDGGMTSCYFTYVAADGKFIADPIWDCDSCLGNVYCERKNASNTAYSTGWAIKTAQYDNTKMTNILGQGFNVSGTTSGNETFEEVVKRIWNDDFVPAISVLKGESSASGTRLRSIEGYINTSPIASYNNYIKWDFQWFPYYEALNGNYEYDLDGQTSYLSDWIVAREKWMDYEINDISDIPQNRYYLTGIGFGGWGAKDYELTKTDDGIYSIDVTLKKDTVYEFKIFDGKSNYYTANLSDETTAEYISYDEDYQNAIITPSEDIDVTILFTGSSFTLRLSDNEYIPKIGDVDCDGSVTIDDATLIQKYIAEIVTLTDDQHSVADADHSGIVTIDDVTTIQKNIADIITSLN